MGTIDLFYTSCKKVLLTNVLYVPKMSRNLVSGNLLGKPRIKVAIDYDKLILFKYNVFVGKGYACDGMFKLCTSIDNVNN